MTIKKIFKIRLSVDLQTHQAMMTSIGVFIVVQQIPVVQVLLVDKVVVDIIYIQRLVVLTIQVNMQY